MTRLAPLWQQNGSYPAATDRALIGTLWPANAVSGGLSTVASGTMNISVAAGTAAVAMSSPVNYSTLCRWDAAEVVTLPAAPPSGQSRIDLIILQVRDQAIDAGGNNDFVFTSVTGTPTTGTPVAPAVPSNALAMCQVLVPGGQATLNSATITNRRVPLNPRDTLHARVYRNAAWTLATGGPVVVPFDTVDFDPAGMFSAGRITVPVAGIYLVSAQVSSSFLAANATEIQAWVNGVALVSGAGTGNQSAYANIRSPINTLLRLAAGDYVQIGAFSNPSALAGSPGPGNTYLNVSYLGSGGF
jgi:hypothetical protein